MFGRGVQVWLAVLGLLGSLVLAPAPVIASCPGDGLAEVSHASDCCSSTPSPQTPSQDREPAPGGDDRCDCPRPCCAAPAPAATLRVAAPEAWVERAVGLIPLATVSADSAEYHLDLMRPPRA